jgi:hypothetical protein
VTGERQSPDPDTLRFLEGIRDQATSQVERINGENETRTRLLQEEIDRRFSNYALLVNTRYDDLKELVAVQQATQDAARLILLDGLRDKFEHEKTARLDLRDLLDERHANQVTAMRTAFEAADKAMAAALAAAKEATLKAEGASDKRFEATNEFRKQLADIIATFMSRVETETRLTALDDKYESATSRNVSVIAEVDRRLSEQLNALTLRLTSRLDLAGGRDEGQSAGRTEQRLNIGQLLQVVVVIVAVLTFIALYVAKK